MMKSKRTSQRASQHTLLQGSYFALHTAGCQARSASTLFNAGEHPTAAGIAMMAREELGKHLLLKGFWIRGAAGTIVTLTEVQKVCGRGSAKGSGASKMNGPGADSHLQKLQAAQISVEIHSQPGTRFYTLSWTVMRARGRIQQHREQGAGFDHPEVRAAYAEAQAADAELKEMARLLNAEAPRLRYELRQEAFYTDLIVDADEEHAGRMRWRRPSDIRLDEAHQRILNTVNDYAGVLDTTFTCVIEENATYSAALEAWVDKPPLPIPVWPRRVEK